MALKILPDVDKAPIGHQSMKYHMAFDINMEDI